MINSPERATTEPVLRDDRVTLVGLLIEIHQGLTNAMAGIHSAHGLLGKEFDALLRLARSHQASLSMRDLAAQTATSTSGTTSLVDRLERRALVDRTVSCTDRRSFDVGLTHAGRALVDDMIADLLPVIERLVSQPLGADAPAVRAALERVRDVVAPHATSGSHPAQSSGPGDSSGAAR